MAISSRLPSYREYPTKVPDNATAREKFLLQLGLGHLLRAQQWFECYQLGPYTAPYVALPKEAYSSSDNLSGAIQSRGKVTIFDGYRTITMPGALTIYDFGDYLATSAGEKFSGTATGPLLKSVEHMMDTLAERGANQVAFDEHCVDAAKVFATAFAVENDMLVYGFDIPEEQRKSLEELLGRRLTKHQIAELAPESPE